MAETLYTVEEAVRRLKMHPDTLRRQLRQGRVKSVWTGKLWRIPESAFSIQEGNSVFEKVASTQNELPEIGLVAKPKDLEVIFTRPTSRGIKQRLQAWEDFGRTARHHDNTVVPDDAVAQGYDERAAQLMKGHR